MNPPRLPTIAGGWTERLIPCGSHKVRLATPADPDAMLDDPATLEANQLDDYMPYWGYLWPAALEMAAVVDRLGLSKEAQVVELGSGLGMVGIAAILSGYQVTLSDYREEPVNVARYNCMLNGIREPKAELIDWRQPPANQYNVVLACDVLYETRDHKPLLAFVEQILPAGGLAWIGDPGRQKASEFLDLLPPHFSFNVFDQELNPIGSQHTGFQLIRLTKTSERCCE